jgi:hypothetical protein
MPAIVADPDPGSGAFMIPDPGKNLDPDLGSGMKVQDHFSECQKHFFGLKILKFFDAIPDPGSGIFTV